MGSYAHFGVSPAPDPPPSAPSSPFPSPRARPDVLSLPSSFKGRKFEVILDSALYHSLAPSNQQAYLRVLAELSQVDTQLVVLCYASPPARNTDAPLPRHVTAEEIRLVFGSENGWRVEEVKAVKFVDRKNSKDGVPGWLTVVTRTE